MSQQVVLAVSGSSRGIGLGIAQYFLRQGFLVAGCSRGPAEEIGPGHFHSQVDISDERQVREWVRSIRRRWGRLDVYVCNAALVPSPALVTATPVEQFDQVFATNVRGAFLSCREIAKLMMVQRAGSIITISSMAAGLHSEGTFAYSASKSALVEMTRILAKELAPVGVTCNAIAPSVYYESAVEALGLEVLARAVESLTIKRPLSIEEICHVIEFYSSPRSSSITGQVLFMGLVQ